MASSLQVAENHSSSNDSAEQVIHAGLVFAIGTAVCLWLSSELWIFVVAMALLGFAWNFMFLAGAFFRARCAMSVVFFLWARHDMKPCGPKPKSFFFLCKQA